MVVWRPLFVSQLARFWFTYRASSFTGLRVSRWNTIFECNIVHLQALFIQSIYRVSLSAPFPSNKWIGSSIWRVWPWSLSNSHKIWWQFFTSTNAFPNGTSSEEKLRKGYLAWVRKNNKNMCRWKTSNIKIPDCKPKQPRTKNSRRNHGGMQNDWNQSHKENWFNNTYRIML